jgi:hypothetical protein
MFSVIELDETGDDLNIILENFSDALLRSPMYHSSL